MTEIEYVKQRITALRMKLRISERQLSGMLGKSPNYIGAVLDQKNPDGGPSMKMFFKICALLRVTPYEFFDEILEKENANKIAIAHNKNDNPYPIQTHAVIEQLFRLTERKEERMDQLVALLERMDPAWFSEMLNLAEGSQK